MSSSSLWICVSGGISALSGSCRSLDGEAGAQTDLEEAEEALSSLAGVEPGAV